MNFFPGSLSIHQKWIGIFGIWLLVISGISKNFLNSPGILQSIRLHHLLSQKQEQLTKSNKEIQRLTFEIEQLEKNRFVQQREIRRILGYAGTDEIVFDFSAAGNNPGH
jgi:cell division protein FtsB